MNKLEELGKATLAAIVSGDNNEHADHYDFWVGLEERASQLDLTKLDNSKQGFDNPWSLTIMGSELLEEDE